MSIDRRRFPRRLFEKKVGCLYQGIYEILDSGEIGEGGMLIFASQTIPIDHKLVVSFLLPNGLFVSAKSEIKNHTKKLSDGRQAHGVAFVDLPFDIKREIRSFVAARAAA